ncbi:YidC/Oxa1 family insertase periplasmic-domain containing protein [candidate division KSB1 bacterium]|nr:YidC/Oxa1 family insertase periplasmic-domain containing protein [candidate division KSB1 bacterium]
MESDKNSLIAIVLIFAVVMTFTWYSSKNLKPPPLKSGTATETQIATPKPAIPDSVSTTPKPAAPGSKRTLSAQTTPGLVSPFIARSADSIQQISVESELFRARISTQGAVISSWRLKKYGISGSKKVNGKFSENDWVELVAPNANFSQFFGTNYPPDSSHYPFGNLSLSFPLDRGDGDTSPLNFYVKSRRSPLILNQQNPVDSLVFYLQLTNGGLIKKTYLFNHQNYDFNLKVELVNLNSVLAQSFYEIEWRSGLSPTENDIEHEMTYAKAYVLTGKELNTKKVEKKPEHKPITGKINWLAVATKYFGMSLVPTFNTSDDYALLDAYVDGQDISIQPGSPLLWKKFAVKLKVPTYSKANISHTYKIYFGPLDYFRLAKYDLDLEKMIDLGYRWLRPLSVGILYAFVFLHRFISNYGVVIIIFSILVKIILTPLTKSSTASMKKMQELQPALNELKEKYGNDTKKLQEAQLKLYKTKGINPAGGCLPFILQMPLLFALYWVFRDTIELRGEPFIWWIKDLSLPDTVFTLPFSLPMYGNKFNILPILMGVSMLVQQQIMMKDPKQKAMVYIMPVFMTLIFNKMSSGLNLYYTLFNVFSLVQQFFTKTTPETDVATDDKKSTSVTAPKISILDFSNKTNPKRKKNK